MRQLVAALTAIVVALATSAAATAGGWATVSVDPMPTRIAPGETWRTELTFLQHGETPLTGIDPFVTITEDERGTTRTFPASPTRRPGVYEARVVFPEAGAWNVAVESGWWGEARLTFGPVAVDGAPVADGSPGFPFGPAGAVVGVLLVAAAGTFGLARLRRLSPAR